MSSRSLAPSKALLAPGCGHLESNEKTDSQQEAISGEKQIDAVSPEIDLAEVD